MSYTTYGVYMSKHGLSTLPEMLPLCVYIYIYALSYSYIYILYIYYIYTVQSAQRQIHTDATIRKKWIYHGDYMDT